MRVSQMLRQGFSLNKFYTTIFKNGDAIYAYPIQYQKNGAAYGYEVAKYVSRRVAEKAKKTSFSGYVFSQWKEIEAKDLPKEVAVRFKAVGVL